VEGCERTIIAAGEEVMGTTTIQKRNVEWFDEECREKIAKKNKARIRMLQKETRGSYEKYKELQKEVKKVCKKRKKEHLQKQLEEIEQLDRMEEENFIKQWIKSGKATIQERSM